jgi:hypothetical protein
MTMAARTHRKRVYDRFLGDPSMSSNLHNPDNQVEIARHPADCKITRDDETGEWVIYGTAPEPNSEEQETDLFSFKDRASTSRRRSGDRRPVIRSLADLNQFHAKHFNHPNSARGRAARDADELVIHNHIRGK